MMGGKWTEGCRQGVETGATRKYKKYSQTWSLNT
jgi:hypothetical protein